MHDLSFLSDLFIVAGVSVLAAMLVGRLRLPAIAGFMLAGAVVGPSGLGLVRDNRLIQSLAEVGVVLLLFTIGLEFSLSRLRRIGRLVAIGGALQVGLTILATVAVVTGVLGFSLRAGVFYGFMVALSSTAIVLRGLAERNEVDSPQGRFIIGALIFQDLAVIPMMLVLPVLAGTADKPLMRIGLALLEAAAMLALTAIVGRSVIPRLFARIDKLRSREVFLLAVLAVCIGASWATSIAGLSLALGAFLAGILLAESDYAHRALGEVLPLRDVLSSLFFLSLGMLLDVSALVERPLAVAAVFLVIFLGKGAIASIACLAMRFPPRVAVLSGACLAQFGEFGFVLAQAGVGLGLLDAAHGRIFLAASLLTMFVTPVSMRVAPSIAVGAKLLRPLERLLGARGVVEASSTDAILQDHIVVAGLGVGGRLLTDALEHTGVPYMVIDLNAEAVRAAATRGAFAFYGDITSEETLRHAHLPRARAFAVLINDPDAARRAVLTASRLAPELPVFVRTKYLAGHRHLSKLPNVNLIVEEVEAGVETLARVLRHADVPMNLIKAEVRQARSQTQESSRVTSSLPRRRLAEMAELAELKIESLVVQAGAVAVGRSATEMQLRTRSGALVVAVRRQGQLVEESAPDFRFAEGDVAYLVGTRDSIRRALELLGE
jgi:monovalent cation:H+ antiporter-2, CPA2 family